MHSVFIVIVWYFSTNTLFNSAEDNKKLLVGTSEKVARVPNGYFTNIAPVPRTFVPDSGCKSTCVKVRFRH